MEAGNFPPVVGAALAANSALLEIEIAAKAAPTTGVQSKLVYRYFKYRTRDRTDLNLLC